MSDISFLYNKRDKQYQTTKVNKETTYYLGVAKICPRCKKLNKDCYQVFIPK